MDRKTVLKVAVLVGSGFCVIFASLWQKEIVDINRFVQPFNFMGFGDFGLDWWSWRDIFDVWHIAGTLLISGGTYVVGTVRERRRRRKFECNQSVEWEERVAGDWCRMCSKYPDLNDCDMWYNVMSGN